MDKKDIEIILHEIIDPDLGTDIISLKLITEIEFDQEKKEVSFLFRPASFTCPLAFTLGLQVKEKLLSCSQIEKVNVRVENYVDKEKLEKILNSQ